MTPEERQRTIDSLLQSATRSDSQMEEMKALHREIANTLARLTELAELQSRRFDSPEQAQLHHDKMTEIHEEMIARLDAIISHHDERLVRLDEILTDLKRMLARWENV